ncbi:hypothetical protein, partial [Microlunatus aurantiacus]|uniref:hypothetical protein n=1 Tax=Microlunatus aurantiacus TaxID=446786 RepID=UPI0031E080FD
MSDRVAVPRVFEHQAKSVLGEDFAVRFGSIISAGSAAAALSESMKASTALGLSAKSVVGNYPTAASALSASWKGRAAIDKAV